MNPNPHLVLGSLDLTVAPFMVDVAIDRGVPENVYEAALSALQHGQVMSSTETANRDITITVHVDAADSDLAAEYEKALMLETEKPRNTLTISPGDGVGPASVFETYRAQIAPVYRDMDEYVPLRSYTITIPAAPFPRAAGLTITPALATPPGTVTTTVVDSGSATTGWSSNPSGVAVSSGALFVNSGLGASLVSMTRTGSVSLTGTPYVVVRAALEFQTVGFPGFNVNPTWVTPKLSAGGQDFSPVAASPQTGGWIDYYYNLTGVTVTALGFYAQWQANANTSATLRIDQITKTSQLPMITRKQQTRGIDVGGAVATEGSIHLSHATGPLGESVVFTYPRELKYQPPLSPWYASGGGTNVVDATRFSGSYRSLTSPRVYDVPAGALPPGTYMVAASMFAGDTGGAKPLDLTVQSRMGGVNVGPAFTTTPVPAMDLSAWKVYLLDQITIPTPVNMDGTVRITLGRNAATTTTVYLDEVWLFHTSGALTLLNYGGRHLWIDAATIDQPRGIWVGTDPDRSDAWSALGIARAAGRHTFQPGGTQLFTAFDGADDVAADLTHYRRYHTLVAEAS